MRAIDSFRVFDETAGVDHNGVRAFGVADDFETIFHQGAGHDFAIDEILGAAE